MNLENGKQASDCLICGAAALKSVTGFAALARITSDCRPFAKGGYLAVCQKCGAVQKRPDATWLQEISVIYAQYAAYYQSGGDEQIVFDRVSGNPRRRSDVFLERMVANGDWPAAGSALDVGCGNGATLSSMSTALPGWSINGFEIGEGALTRLQAIRGFRKLFTGSIESIKESFDLVTMIHSLEHFPSPKAVLDEVLPLVGGKLFIEVCNVEENPFDILIADHLMHFSPGTLARLLENRGFAPAIVATDWVPKEISALAEKQSSSAPPRPQSRETDSTAGEKIHRRIETYVDWLNMMVNTVMECSRGDRPFGIFGTSIAATWIAAQLGSRVKFFVDEDESRVGKQHMQCPILHPNDVPPDSTVYLALAPGIAEVIKRRLAHVSCALVSPPPMGVG